MANQYTKKNPFKDNKYEILWNMINSTIAGGLVMLGAFTTRTISKESIYVAAVAGLIVFASKFKDYWQSEESEFKGRKGQMKILAFLPTL